MKLEGSYRMKSPRSRVWWLITSPEVLERCVPGCRSLEENEDGSYRMEMKAGVGSIKGLFHGNIMLDEIIEPEHYRMTVDGKGSPGFLKGVGNLDLREDGEETVIDYVGEVTVGGTIASVGQRMVLSSAKLIISQFFTSIEAEADAWARAEESGEPFEPPKHGFFRNTLRQIKK